MAGLAVWQRTIVDEEGNVVPGAEVEVRHAGDTALADLFEDRLGTIPLPNPVQADMSGFVRFFVKGGAYDITATGAGASRTWRFHALGTAGEFDFLDFGFRTDRTVRVPSDYPTIQHAIEALTLVAVATGVRITILIEKGYRIPTGERFAYTFPSEGGPVGARTAVLSTNVNHGHFVIRSEDDHVVQVAEDFSGSLFIGVNSVMPKLECQIDMAGRGDHGYSPYFQSDGWVEELCGVLNAGRWGTRVRSNSRLLGRNARFTGARERGFYGNHGSVAYIRDADFSGAWGYGMRVSNMPVLDAGDAVADNCSVGIEVIDTGDYKLQNVSAQNCGTALSVDGSANVYARGFNGSGATNNAVEVNRGALVNLGVADLSGAGGHAVRVFGSGSIVTIAGADLSGSGEQPILAPAGNLIIDSDALLTRSDRDPSGSPPAPIMVQSLVAEGRGFNEPPREGIYGTWDSPGGPGGQGWSFINLPRSSLSAAQIAVRAPQTGDASFPIAVRTAIDASAGEWNKWQRVYTSKSLVGTVSDDDDGDPNGSIFQSGSNYTLYADGTMECWGEVNLGPTNASGNGNATNPYRTGTSNWSFPTPVPFVNPPNVTLSLIVDSGTVSERTVIGSYRSVSTTGISTLQAYSIPGTGPGSAPVVAHIIVKGRWK